LRARTHEAANPGAITRAQPFLARSQTPEE
jgi:hypothetical protein